MNGRARRFSTSRRRARSPAIARSPNMRATCGIPRRVRCRDPIGASAYGGTSMASEREPLTARPAWDELRAHHTEMEKLHLRELFARDPARGERMTAEAAGLFLDYSKNRLTDETLRLLVRVAEESGLRGRIEQMFRGERDQ